MEKFKLLILSSVLAFSCGVNAKTINETVEVKNCRVYDGDTIYCDLPCKLSWRCNGIGIRLKGIDTPEIGWRAKCISEKIKGIASKTWMYSMVLMANKIEIKNFKPNGAYGRIEADVFIDGKNAAEELLANG